MEFSMNDAVEAAASPAPRLVILHPLPLYAAAICAVVCRDSRWDVVGMTAEIDAAVTLSAEADAVVFDSRRGSITDVLVAAHRLRKLRPDLPLVLLTRHDGRAFLDEAADADLDAVLHMRDTAVSVSSALAAVALGRRFRSPLLDNRGNRKHAVTGAPGVHSAGQRRDEDLSQARTAGRRAGLPAEACP